MRRFLSSTRCSKKDIRPPSSSSGFRAIRPENGSSGWMSVAITWSREKILERLNRKKFLEKRPSQQPRGSQPPLFQPRPLEPERTRLRWAQLRWAQLRWAQLRWAQLRRAQQQSEAQPRWARAVARGQRIAPSAPQLHALRVHAFLARWLAIRAQARACA